MTKSADLRPEIATIMSAAELKRWYWLKDELTTHARNLGMKTTGAKFDVLDRIGHFLDTDDKNWPGDAKPKATSKFDWNNAQLTPETIITDNYKSSQNVRRFFSQQLGFEYKFTIAAMAWMKENVGKSLGDAIVEIQRQLDEAKTDGFKTKIQPHNQFNQYTRDFLDANPDLGMKDVRRIWALKRALPSDDGRHIYEDSDLEL